MKKYILLAAKYEYTKVKKERKKEEKEKQDVVHNIDAASHVVPRNEASAPLHYPLRNRPALRPGRSHYRRFYPQVLRPAPSIRSNKAAGWGVPQRKGCPYESLVTYRGMP